MSDKQKKRKGAHDGPAWPNSQIVPVFDPDHRPDDLPQPKEPEAEEPPTADPQADGWGDGR